MKIIGNIFYTLFVILLIGVAGLFLTTLLPLEGNIQVKIVKSGSMEPSIETGSIVVVKPAATYYADDVITFGKDTKDQIPTTHRVLEKTVENGVTMYQTKGDANEDLDPALVPESAVIGKVWFSVPYAGYVLDAARQPLGFTFMIGIPAGIIILDEVIKIWLEVAGVRRRKEKIDRRKESQKGTGPRTNVRLTMSDMSDIVSRTLSEKTESVNEFETPQRIAAGKPLDAREDRRAKILEDVNTLDLTKVWGPRPERAHES
jgi:signal peptidase I